SGAAFVSIAAFVVSAFSISALSAAAACLVFSSSRGFDAGGVIFTLGAGCTRGVTVVFFAPPSFAAGGAVGLPHGFAAGVACGLAVSVAALGSATGFDSAFASAALLSVAGCVVAAARCPDFFEPVPLPGTSPIFGRSGKPVCSGRNTGNLISAPSPSM